ncbi:unnamed protein product [Clonostachys chloroleuca]|uniref:Uncharacterized protein n=1 Tax=Clonostachys chloroleuca TaxID=1926264 RepID=A0AA35PYI6_9HYPO|nr:unnamed protein product [Clonostachys chloroleuca]
MQRGVALGCGFDVGALFNQILDDGEFSGQNGRVEGSGFIVDGAVRIPTTLDQDLDNVKVALLSGGMEGRPCSPLPGLFIGPLVQKKRSVPFLVLGLDLGVLIEQLPDSLNLAAPRGFNQVDHDAIANEGKFQSSQSLVPLADGAGVLNTRSMGRKMLREEIDLRTWQK